MSTSATAQPAEPLLELPGGFPPDTIGFAVRTTVALLLAYFVSFWMQLSSASTAGICVAIVAQPQFGGTMSKAAYRVLGTLIGGIAAVIATAVFGQDRSMLLVVFTLWLAGCSFVASLLKDFRAYGAALAGYTLAIVSVTMIDHPQEVFLTALDRVAAILVGVASLALVNGIFGRADAWQALTGQLRQMIAETTEHIIDGLRGDSAARSIIDEANWATAVLALRTQATFVAGELPAGRLRAAGARSAIAALLGMVSTNRAIKAGLAQAQPDPAARLAIERTVEALRKPDADGPRPGPGEALPDGASELPQVFLLEHLDDLVTQHGLALDGLAALTLGRQPLRRVRLPSHHDWVGAALNGTRTAIVAGLAALFCIYAGWSGATFLLVQISAVVTLLGMAPDPTRAAVLLGAQFPLAIVACGLVQFLLLPQVGDFVPFALAVAPFALLSCALARLPALGMGSGSGMLVWYVLMLAPTNPPNYDLAAFLNLALEMIGSALAMIIGFAVILPVSPRRRLFRITNAALRDVRRTLRRGPRFDRKDVLSVYYDRFATALVWLGRQTPARLGTLSWVRDLGELSATLSKTETALEATVGETPALAGEVAAARAALLGPSATELRAAAAALLTAARAPGLASAAALRAASGLYGASLLVRRLRSLLRLADGPARF
jgi:uncharacterized membrane protein YccC